MDTHQGNDLPRELREKIERRVRSGEKDEHDVVDRGVVIDREGSKMHCILDAPDVDAVRKHHDLMGVPLDADTVHRADAILR